VSGDQWNLTNALRSECFKTKLAATFKYTWSFVLPGNSVEVYESLVATVTDYKSAPVGAVEV